MASNRTSVIAKKIYPIIQESFDKKNTITRYKKNIQNFIEARSKELYEIAPYTRIYFTQKDVDKFFRSVGFTENQIKNELKNTYY